MSLGIFRGSPAISADTDGKMVVYTTREGDFFSVCIHVEPTPQFMEWWEKVSKLVEEMPK